MAKKSNGGDPFLHKNVLVTGGTGSFGKAFIKKLIREDAVSKLIVFSRDELKQWEMKQKEPEFAGPKIRYFLGDVRDEERLRRAFHEVDIIIHAAALKQVPAAEYNPTEFVKTNIIGAMNIINCAIDSGVKKVIALSTDKAVNPVNLYGATKLCSDKLFLASGSYVGKRGYPIFSVVRYGNVLGSRGSLLPHWKQLIAAGSRSIPITDERMTRFWITLNQATDFVKYACRMMQGSEIFIPKCPSVRIVDLAKAVAPDVKISLCGIRPGEKIHEVLLSQDESRNAFETDTGYIIYPHGRPIDSKGVMKAAPQDFVLASHTNPHFETSPEKIKKLIKLSGSLEV